MCKKNNFKARVSRKEICKIAVLFFPFFLNQLIIRFILYIVGLLATWWLREKQTRWLMSCSCSPILWIKKSSKGSRDRLVPWRSFFKGGSITLGALKKYKNCRFLPQSITRCRIFHNNSVLLGLTETFLKLFAIDHLVRIILRYVYSSLI